MNLRRAEKINMMLDNIIEPDPEKRNEITHLSIEEQEKVFGGYQGEFYIGFELA